MHDYLLALIGGGLLGLAVVGYLYVHTVLQALVVYWLKY